MLNMNFAKYKGSTLLRDWWGVVKSHITEVQSAHNTLEQAFDVHCLLSEDEMRDVKSSISSETELRVGADKALSDAIDDESIERARADGLLTDRIDTERTARMNGDDELRDVIENLDLGPQFRNKNVLETIDGIELENWRKHCSIDVLKEIESVRKLAMSAVQCIREIYELIGVALYDGGIDDEYVNAAHELSGGNVVLSYTAEVDCGTIGTSTLSP